MRNLQVKILGPMVLLLAAAASAYALAPAETPEPTQHDFVVKNFKTESDAVLPEARILCDTYGEDIPPAPP
jgi:homoserine O-acetyltransferase